MNAEAGPSSTEWAGSNTEWEELADVDTPPPTVAELPSRGVSSCD